MMGVPSRRVTDAEMAAKTDLVLKKLMAERGLTPEEFARRVKDFQLPFNPMRPLGLAIQAERKARNMSRRQLANRAGLSPRFVTALERGFLKDLSLAALFNIAFGLGVSTEHILKRSGWSESE
jgi:DNA-binding XRE family transcriptional regulator